MKCVGRFGLGYTHDVFIFARHMFMHFSCIRTFFFLFLVSGYDVFYVLFFSFLPLSLYRIDCIMAPKCKSTPAQNPLRGSGSSTSFNPLPLFTFDSLMRRLKRTSWRTSSDAAFIRNAKLFCRITSTLLSLLSLGLGAGILSLRNP